VAILRSQLWAEVTRFGRHGAGRFPDKADCVSTLFSSQSKPIHWGSFKLVIEMGGPRRSRPFLNAKRDYLFEPTEEIIPLSV